MATDDQARTGQGAAPADPQGSRSGCVTKEEEEAVAARRKLAYSTEEYAAHAADPHWGLALSGGGVRSATFCFGVLRALAKNGVFRRFDYLSTVSGGGYIGAAIGRLFDGKATPAGIEDALASKDSVLLWWLRSNGRYLTPAGARDVMQGFASVLRGVVSTHFEVGVLLMVLGAAMTFPSLFLQREPHWQPASMWLWFLPLAAFVAFHHIFAYWFVRSPRTLPATALDAVVALACAAGGWAWGRSAVMDLGVGPGARTLLPAAACLLLFAPLTGLLLVGLHRKESVSEARLRHTQGLASALWLALVFLLVGLVDWASAWLAGVLAQQRGIAWAALPAVPAFVVTGGRFVLPYVQGWIKRKKANRQEPVKTLQLLNVVGIVALLALALAWATLFHIALQADWDWPRRWLFPAMDAQWARPFRWAILGGVPLAYTLATLNSLGVLNLSSLHNFYRARIERAYVSCGNRARFKKGVLVAASREATRDLRSLRKAEPGDDIDLKQYRPWEHGGPIHLINCCINQTVDDRTQSYNADRKGIALAVSSFGAETGGQPPDPAVEVPGSLSTWTAVSGAAASSGMGSQTSPGLAALLFLSDLRLGYWQTSLEPEDKRAQERRLIRPAMIQAEGMARFPGLRSPQWYLSDGGHFENTGVYALLKRRLPLVVMADCGADPEYGYEDLENLVRKAQIDYGADIRFVVPPPPQEPPPGQAAVPMAADEKRLREACGLPAQVTKEAGAPFLLLAQIAYDDPAGAKGTLVVVKPRCLPDLSLDVSAYARRNPAFPQQTTGDQFFDEAQWEAYHQLGYHLGRWLTADNLARMQAWVQAA